MTEAVKIPERSQIPVEETWNLADLYPSDQAWEQDLEATRALARKLPGYAGRLGESTSPSWPTTPSAKATRTPGWRKTRPWWAR